MFLHYLKIAIRNLWRQKIYTVINVAGLAVGISCCVLIYFYVSFELSYDDYHADKELVFRVAVDGRSANERRIAASTPGPVAPTLKDDFPQVEYAARIFDIGSEPVKNGSKIVEIEKVRFVDSDILNILTIPFIEGDPATALNRPLTALLTESASEGLFGDENPVGKTIEINRHDFEVTGIIADSPRNTHLKYNIFLSIKTLEGKYPLDHWFLYNFHTYIKLYPNIDVGEFSGQIQNLSYQYVQEELDKADTEEIFFLQPIEDIHLRSHLIGEIEPPGNSVYVYLFSTVSVLVLLIACMNFMNLSTARAAKRAKEVGVRKVVGAYRSQLIYQFLAEALLMSIAASFTAIIIIEFTLPLFNQFTNTFFDFSRLMQLDTVLLLVGTTLLVGLVAGGYPAVILSMFKPVVTIKGNIESGSRGAILRKILVLSQFVIAIILIIGASIIYQQLNYMKNRPLGFSKEQKLIVQLPGVVRISDNFQDIKSQLYAHHGITGAAAASQIPGQGMSCWDTKQLDKGEDSFRAINYLYIDPDFIPEYDMTMAAGRNFSADISADIGGRFVVNESAVSALGWKSPEEALGKIVEGGYSQEDMTWEIVGVVKDFHYRGLQSPIEPLIMAFVPRRFKNITMEVKTENLSETIAYVESVWNEHFEGYQFNYAFLDESFNRQYHSEVRLSKLISSFTVLGLIISCLGLFGLISYSVDRRTKEIGIRKVLGASISRIVVLLTKEFTLWVVTANLIAWPAAYLLMRSWLESFAYRIDISLWIFILAGISAMIIALLTVSFQAVRAAAADPVKSLRYE